jgi:hypothetical protein
MGGLAVPTWLVTQRAPGNPAGVGAKLTARVLSNSLVTSSTNEMNDFNSVPVAESSVGPLDPS